MCIVKLVTVTPEAEKNMAYIARVSNPSNQKNEKIDRLLAYCIKHGHWSVFEQAHMTLEINTQRDISAQILRHRSFTFQEFSGRYADVTAITEQIPLFQLRRQDTKNRQNSIDDLPKETIEAFEKEVRWLFDEAYELYKKMLDAGVAKECARRVLPISSPTRIYMTGNIRNWIHYIELRSANGTQKEHMDIALECKKIFMQLFPVISTALEWKS